ncbi:MAG TPA: DNA translocase FtsK 4TM domain-containing protein, partial [Gammaproteobacteria bacterium]|nr:DNA translocase FtsK 4TM domain-containing protein [Gammaproteobacteria bacterium]
MSRIKSTSVARPFFVPRIRGLRESALWLAGGLATILFVALASYDPGDPAFSVSGDTQTVTNRMGPAGAWFADVAYLLFGGPAYLFPVLVMLGGYLFFRGRERPASAKTVAWRGAGFALTLLASCGLATLHFAAPQLRETAGGVIGQLVGGGFAYVLSPLGATV